MCSISFADTTAAPGNFSFGWTSGYLQHLRELPTVTSENGFDAELHRACAILESVEKQYPPDSEEALAIRDAALAYIVVHQQDRLKRSYDRLRAALGGTLTEEMKADLRRHGIEPDEMETEGLPD